MPVRAAKFFLTLLGLVLAVAVGLQAFALANQRPMQPPPNLEHLIPSDVPGWTMRNLPLAETEETKNAVTASLLFDRYVSRVYTRGGQTLIVYVAYWGPGKVPPKMVGVHTPDTCWIQNGWRCTQRQRAVPINLPDGSPLKPAEVGTYTISNTTQHVYFWHLVGGQPYSYEQEGLHSLTAGLRDLANFGLSQRQEQIFVRFSANVPFEELENDEGYKHLFVALAGLGLLAG